MALTPRQTVRSHLLTKLATISPEHGYRTKVQTVALRQGLSRDLNLSDCPAILVSDGDDAPVRDETMGNNDANGYFREWALELHLVLVDPGDDAIEDAIEGMIADVDRCLITNRFSGGKPSNLRLGAIRPSEFERIENGRAEFMLHVIARYDYTVRDL